MLNLVTYSRHKVLGSYEQYRRSDNLPLLKRATDVLKADKVAFSSCLKQTDLHDDKYIPLWASSIEKAVPLLYGEAQAGEICRKIFEKIEATRRTRPVELIKEDMQRPSDWYKQEVVYSLYPDRFGTKATGSPTTFWDLISMLDYLKDLGVTTLYILPFLDSPMVDAGFDVRNYKKVRKDLGGKPSL